MSDVANARSTPDQRLAAIATAAGSVASRRSLSSTLEVLAEAVRSSGGVAGVQILTLSDDADRFRVLGAAGFGRIGDFFERLLECRARGATLEMFRAFDERRTVVVPHRYEALRSDPAWAPLHDFLSTPRWDGFASIPMIGREGAIGVLNVFMSVGFEPDADEVAFFQAMAEQAALAIEYAELFERERETVRQEERQRLARDLHDSVVQQVFSISMQVRSLSLMARKGDSPSAEAVSAVADDLAGVAAAALRDLRGMVDELRPGVAAHISLEDSLTSLARATAARTGITVDVSVSDSDSLLDDLPKELAEDVYRIVAEAVHNSVKHAGAGRIETELVATAKDRSALQASVVDDGTGGVRGANGESLPGYGLVSMRDRALRWGGTLAIEDVSPHGTAVRLVIPLAMAGDERWTAFR